MTSVQWVYPEVLLMAGFSVDDLNTRIKSAAHAIGDALWELASSHGYRRGFACDMATEGDSNLKDILTAGDWKSKAFRDYLRGVEDDLNTARRRIKKLTDELAEASFFVFY